MKKTAVISFFLLYCLTAIAQVSFKTVVPSLPVVEGESFRVQYVAENCSDIENFISPPFKGFRLVTDPQHTEGKTGFGASSKKTYNTVYTLKAIEAGHYQILGAVATIDGRLEKSNDTWIEVISRSDADESYKQSTTLIDDPSFLKPGEDPYQKIKQNLFVKVMVNRKSCYPGEPVLATFQLFSRLQSSSDIIKNPGFYGFTIYDMINLADKEKSVEMINGKMYDVHTIRKVQLYPLQPGIYTIDPMEIRNKVEFSRSTVNRKSEQKIKEGVFDEPDYIPDPGMDVFENTISTTPVIINVKPIAAKNKPAAFNGATGTFKIEASVENDELAKNQEGFLTVRISGKGNFTQLSAPVLQWPAAVEGFEPSVIDSLDKQTVPLTGSRTFKYGFVSGTPGTYEMPAINFEYYDADSNKYKTVTTTPIRISVNNKEKAVVIKEEKKNSISAVNKKASLIAGAIILCLVIAALIYWTWPKSKSKLPVIVEESKPVNESVEEILKPALLLIPAADSDFYKTLQQCTWKFFSQRLAISGSEMTKSSLAIELTNKSIPNELIISIVAILSECEMGIFTNAELNSEKEMLAEKTKTTLKEIEENLL